MKYLNDINYKDCVGKILKSENSIKLNKFIDLAVEYHTDWNFCSRTFREFCKDRCSNDWLDDFESLFLH